MKWKIYYRYTLRIFSWPFRMIWRLFRGTDGKLRKFASWTEKSGYYQILKLLEVAAIFVTIITFQMDGEDRKVEREDRKANSHNQAWSLIASVSGVQDIGNIGVGNALEILKNDGVSLDEINLPGAWLRRVDLSRASLAGANFEKAILLDSDLLNANLTGANLSGADLSIANLEASILWRADLSRAKLSDADLSGADLSGASLAEADLTESDLSKAKFAGANLSGADFSEADLSESDFSGINLVGISYSELESEFERVGIDLSKQDIWGGYNSDDPSGGARSIKNFHSGANLSKANLRTAKGLTQAQIDVSCYRKTEGEVLLPDGFKQPPECPEKYES